MSRGNNNDNTDAPGQIAAAVCRVARHSHSEEKDEDKFDQH